ncbi:hypothetical protein [Marinobacter sp.]|uniref:hypothetical protein n=1 Tax=Marinobacter sp. TaxID=50741 RepID=UPI00384F9175
MLNKHFYRALLRDTLNRLRFGRAAPRYGERIWVNAPDCRGYLSTQVVRKFFRQRPRSSSALVVSKWPSSGILPLSSHPKVHYCLRRWGEGLSWEEAGAHDYMLSRMASSQTGSFDGCRTREDIDKRLAQLDRIFETVRAEGRFREARELSGDHFRETGATLIHLGPNAVPFFAGAGAHRFAMALVLDLPLPAQLGLVHRTALPQLKDFRFRPQSGA